MNAKIGRNVSICLCPSAINVIVYFHYPCSSVHATDCLWLPSWHRLRSCIDIDFAFVSTSASHYIDIGCAYSWYRLRINSNNPWNPTYLNSAELPNSLWHRLRIILTSVAHFIDIGFALTLTILETQPTLTLQNSQLPFDIGFAFALDLLIFCDFHRFPMNFSGILWFSRFSGISRKSSSNFPY